MTNSKQNNPKGQPWRLIPSDWENDCGHMSFDGSLYGGFEDGDTPILRFFSFDKPTLTLGRIEARKLDLARLEWPYEIRPTGGRAVLHGAGDLCYAVVASVKDLLVGGTLLESYRKISSLLAAGLKGLGRKVELSGDRHRGLEGPHCFSAPSFGELTLEGRKVAGGAQARRGGVFLQQGVILLSVDPGWSRLGGDVASTMVGLNDVPGLPPISKAELEKSLTRAFSSAGIEFTTV